MSARWMPWGIDTLHYPLRDRGPLGHGPRSILLETWTPSEGHRRTFQPAKNLDQNERITAPSLPEEAPMGAQVH
jgi:hypothetical protein